MADKKDFNECLLENVQAACEETRELKNDISNRMDRIENRMDRLEDKVDNLSDKLDFVMREIRARVAEPKKTFQLSEYHKGLLRSASVSAIVTTICWVLIHWKGI